MNWTGLSTGFNSFSHNHVLLFFPLITQGNIVCAFSVCLSYRYRSKIQADQRSIIGEKSIMIGQHSIPTIILIGPNSTEQLLLSQVSRVFTYPSVFMSSMSSIRESGSQNIHNFK